MVCASIRGLLVLLISVRNEWRHSCAGGLRRGWQSRRCGLQAVERDLVYQKVIGWGDNHQGVRCERRRARARGLRRGWKSRYRDLQTLERTVVVRPLDGWCDRNDLR